MSDTDTEKFSMADTGSVAKCTVISDFQRITRPLWTLVEIVYITCVTAESVCHVLQK